MLFSNTTYHISPSLPPQTFELVQHIFEHNGGTASIHTDTLEDVDVVVTDTPHFEGWQAFRDLQQRDAEGTGKGIREKGKDSWGCTEDGKEDKEKKERWTVTPKWVEKSAVLGKVQPPQFYSPDPTQLFSGVVACATELPAVDLEVLSGGIIALGGQWRTGLTKEVTHLFAIRARPPVDENAPPGTSTKYATAFHFQAQTGVKVLLPHWFDDCVRLGITAEALDTKPYEWPDPPYLSNSSLTLSHLLNPAAAANHEKERQKKKAGNVEKDPLKKSVFESSIKLTPNGVERGLDVAAFSSSGDAPGVNGQDGMERKTKDVWKGKRFVLSRSLRLVGGRREAVEASITRCGGVVVRFEGDESAFYDDDGEEVVDEERGGNAKLTEPKAPKPPMNEQDKTRKERKARELDRREAVLLNGAERVDVYITRWREGRGYVQAHLAQQKITIATLAWVYHVQTTGVVTRPGDQLLHYPIPRGRIPGFDEHEITVTNYTGEAREYLKKLIISMGARFTPSMSARNTVLVAATKDSTKALKALSWSIPVVNHTWLEDCFIQWRNLTPATEKYVSFPHGVDFSGVLGVRGVLGGGPALTEGKERKTKIDEEVEGLLEYYKEEDERDAMNPLEPSPEPADQFMDVDKTKGDDHGGMEIDDDEEEGDVELSIPQATVGSAVDVDEVQALVQGESEVEVEVEVTPRKRKPQSKKGEEREKESPKNPSSSSKRGAKNVASEDENEVEMVEVRKRPAGKASSKSPAKKGSGRQEDEEEEEEREGLRVSPRKETKSTSSPSKRNVHVELVSPAKKPAEATPKKTTMKERMKPSPKKTRVVSPVVEPDETSGDERERRNERDETMARVLNEESEDEEDEELDLGKSIKGKKPEDKKKAKPGLLDHQKGDATTRVRKSLGGDETKKPKKARIESPSSSEEELPQKKGTKGKAPAKDAKGRGKGKKAVESEDDEKDGDAMNVDDEHQAGPSKRGKRSSWGGKNGTTARPASKQANTAKSTSKQATIAKPPSKSAPTKPASKSAITVKPASKSVVPAKAVRAKGRPVQLPSEDEEEDAMEVDDDPNRRGIRPSSPLSEPPSSHPNSPGQSTTPTPSYAPSSDAGSSIGDDDEDEPQAGGRRRRNAAAKASQKLHDELMPDLVHFEEQLKKSKKGRARGRNSDYFVVEGDTPAKPTLSSAKRKKVQEKEEEGEVEEVEKEKENAGRKRRKSDGGKKAKDDGRGSEEENAEEEDKRGKKKRRVSDTKSKEKTAESEGPQRDIIILATQVKFDERTTKAMVALGAKFTDKPTHCTHLVAKGLVRTEKFLCALARAPFIISEDWVRECVKAKKILLEENYTLQDPAGEAKYGVTLKTALERARKSQGTLLKGKVFYVTPKVQVGPQLIRSLIVALGGTFQAATPTPRIVQNDPENRTVISAPEDNRIWKPIAEAGYPVYSQELILMGALRQKIGWEDKTCRLDHVGK